MSKTLHYNFANRKSLTPVNGLGPTLDITRATIGTYFDSAGVMQTASAGEPRFDHDPVTGRSLGLLVEGARTNICLQSEDFSTTWTTSAAEVDSANAAVAPDGASTADEIGDDGTGTAGHRFTQAVSGLTAAASYTFSVFAKSAKTDFVAVYSAAPIGEGKFFDLSAGTVGSNLGSAPDDAGIEDYGNGWYRCWITVTTASTSHDFEVYIADSSSDHTYNGDDLHSIYAWGAQIEAGAYLTSYIPTTTTSVARNVDAVTTSDMSWFDQTQGTVYVDAKTGGPVQNYFLQIDDGSNSNRYGFYRQSGNFVRTFSIGGAVNDATSGLLGAIADGESLKLASAYKVNDWAAVRNGGAIGSDTTFDVPATPFTILRVGNFSSTAQELDGHIAEIAYWDERLPNATLESYSALGLPLEDIEYPKDSLAKDEEKFHAFILSSGITPTGDLVRDYREALATNLSLTEHEYSVQDLFKRYYETL